ncbi:hypothetical protein KL911_000623 [Ogataea haglerorum]|uniref:uncharacterized protein n=1 Tax=Ogataea haglerorum TaxID=1937702 RepID=UPI001C895D18|nr:uncharacterized protein KL911_000623 [Ogataea haglerorum]KAG7757647.1 hypothetical protein KL911_000623 [Ogataea haglerorum]
MNMDMGSPSSSSMHMSMATATSSMDMTAASSTSSMDMNMSMDMEMNYYLTTHYNHYPVIFHNLRASSGAGAFGIFCVLFFGAIFFRGLFFLSAYLEQRVFHNLTNAVLIEEIDNCACVPEEDQKHLPSGGTLSVKSLSLGKIISQTFCPGLGELKRDFIRLLIAFTATMFGYALMLAAMSFVLLYFFAICLGMAFGEILFNRLSIVLGINKNSSLCGSLH